MISYIKFELATTYFYIVLKIPPPAQPPALHPSTPSPPPISFEPRPQGAFPKEKHPGDEVGLVFMKQARQPRVVLLKIEEWNSKKHLFFLGPSWFWSTLRRLEGWLD